MIGSLRGSVLERSADSEVLLEVGGVGYLVTVTPRTLAELEPGATVFLHVHHHIREDAQTLFGFLRREERTTFQVLIATHGVGPALAMSILGTHAPVALVDIVASSDTAALTLVPGRREEDSGAAADRTEEPPEPAAARSDRCGRARRRQQDPRSATYARRCTAWVTRRTKCVTRCARSLAVATRRPCCARRCNSWGHDVREEFLDPGVNNEVEETDEVGLRPRRLADFVGQRELKEHLTIVLEAARGRNQPIDHLLLAGPPGLGKTTLAGIVAAEMGVQMHITSGPTLERAGDLAAILTKLGEGDVLFIDEIHRLSRNVEEILYPAMEDYQLDIVVGKGPAASSIRLPLPPFTLVGATTRTGMITGPLRDRFGLVARLDFYHDDELEAIVRRAAGILGVEITEPARGRSPAAAVGRRASRTACCAVCATTPRFVVTAPSTRTRRAPVSRCSVSTNVVSTRSIGPSSPPSACSSAAVPSACPPSRSASVSRPRPSRTSTSRSSSNRAYWRAHRVGASRCRVRGITSGCSRPASPATRRHRSSRDHRVQSNGGLPAAISAAMVTRMRVG